MFLVNDWWGDLKCSPLACIWHSPFWNMSNEVYRGGYSNIYRLITMCMSIYRIGFFCRNRLYLPVKPCSLCAAIKLRGAICSYIIAGKFQFFADSEKSVIDSKPFCNRPQSIKF